MIDQQSVTVNLHRPKIKKVVRQSTGSIAVELGNEQLHGTVDVFFEDLDAVREFIAALDDKIDELEAPGGKFVEALVAGVVAS